MMPSSVNATMHSWPPLTPHLLLFLASSPPPAPAPSIPPCPFTSPPPTPLQQELLRLRSLPALVVLDLAGNPLAAATEDYRLQALYHLRRLKVGGGGAGLLPWERGLPEQLLWQ